MASLLIEGVGKKFGRLEIVKDVNISVDDKEFVVLVGPSGCGKSTILRMVAGLEEVSSGTIKIDDVVVNNLSPFERGISMVFQSYALYPHMTVFENISFPLSVEGLADKVIKERVNGVAEILELEKCLNRFPKELSGGQKQRVAIGRSIIRKPKIFLFDEPLSNLDDSRRKNTRPQGKILQ